MMKRQAFNFNPETEDLAFRPINWQTAVFHQLKMTSQSGSQD